MRHAARQLPSWLIFDVGQIVKASLLTIMMLTAGCTAISAALAVFEGWSHRDIALDVFEVRVGRVWEHRDSEALYYAALVCAQRGDRYFTIREEDGSGSGGTRFAWKQSEIVLSHQPPNSFVHDFSPGVSFTVLVSASSGPRVFDADQLVEGFKRWRKESFP